MLLIPLHTSIMVNLVGPREPKDRDERKTQNVLHVFKYAKMEHVNYNIQYIKQKVTQGQI